MFVDKAVPALRNIKEILIVIIVIFSFVCICICIYICTCIYDGDKDEPALCNIKEIAQECNTGEEPEQWKMYYHLFSA